MLNTLNVSHTGLNAAKIAVENVSNNIANENTPGYKKRVVQLSEIEQMDSRFTGRGVNASGTYRITSQYMYDKLISENTKVNYYDKLSNMLSNVESIFAETTDSGFSADLNRYFQSIENLRTNPNSEIYKTTLKSQGSILVGSLQNLYTSVEKQQANEKDEMYVNVEKVNTLLKEIGSINEKIEKYDSVNNDLLDKRDQLELELSNYVDISVDRREGFYELKIAGESVISNNTNVRTINTIENNTSQIDKFYHREFNVDGTFQIKDSIKFESDGITDKGLDDNDIVTYKLNNEFEISATIGDNLTADWDNDSLTPDTTEEITKDNLIRALVIKINSNTNMKGIVTAYNGDYAISSNGDKIINNTKDNYLRIESKFTGNMNDFDGRISIQKIDDTNPSIIEDKEVVYRNEDISLDAESKLAIGIFDKEINLKSGILKAQIENLSSVSDTNKYQTYLDKLDSFVQTLSDISDKYIKDTSTSKYIYGESASDNNMGVMNSVGLFSGTSVKTLKFNANAVNDLNQEKLDYLATIQWKTDLKYDGFGQDIDSDKKISLLEFFRDLKVNVAADKENTKFLKETQKSVKQSIQSSYDQLTKVNNDEEMLNLVKFQAAYTANAKIVTVIDEMIQTLLGLKR